MEHLDLWLYNFSMGGLIENPYMNDIVTYSETRITRTAQDYQKSLSYEKFELWVMLSLCFSHVGTVANPFHSSAFRSLAKLSKIWEIFFSYEQKNIEIKLVTQECKHIQPQKRQFDGTNSGLSVRVMTKGSRYAQQITITQAGTIKLGLS